MASTPLAVVVISYKYYLIPRAKATKLIELLSDVVECDPDFSAEGVRYVVDEAPSVELRFVEPRQIVMPDGVSIPRPTRRRATKAIAQQPLRVASK